MEVSGQLHALATLPWKRTPVLTELVGPIAVLTFWRRE